MWYAVYIRLWLVLVSVARVYLTATEGKLMLMAVASRLPTLYYCHPAVIENYTPCQVSGHVHHTLWIRQISEDMRRHGRQFCRLANLLNSG